MRTHRHEKVQNGALGSSLVKEKWRALTRSDGGV
jgi:hypothetical protein